MSKLRIAGTLGLMIVLTAAGIAAQPEGGTPEDEAALRKVQESFAAAWNRHDAAAMARLWTEDGDWMGPDGYFAEGRARVENYLADAHTENWATTKNTLAVRSVRFIKPDVAVVNAECHLTGSHDWWGNPVPDQKIVGTSIMVKKDGEWLISAFRASIPPPPAEE